MFKSALKFIMVLSALPALFACSAQLPSKDKVAESVKKVIPVNFDIASVTPFKQVPGLVQVVLSINKQPVVIYMDFKAKYIVSGSILDLETRKNLTAETINSFTGPLKGSSATPALPAPQAK